MFCFDINSVLSNEHYRSILFSAITSSTFDLFYEVREASLLHHDRLSSPLVLDGLTHCLKSYQFVFHTVGTKSRTSATLAPSKSIVLSSDSTTSLELLTQVEAFNNRGGVESLELAPHCLVLRHLGHQWLKHCHWLIA